MNKEKEAQAAVPEDDGLRHRKNAPIFRSIYGAEAYLREKDPGSEVTAYMIRQAVLMGKIPARQLGRKIIVNMENVIEFFEA